MRSAISVPFLLAALAAAAPAVRRAEDCGSPDASSTSAPSSTSSTSASTASATAPAYTAPFTVTAARSGSAIQFQPLNAAGLSFWIGGNTASYCPESVSDCPPGNVTALLGSCSLDVQVPGGQQIWATPDGKIGYTQAHSISTPADSVLCPLTYTKEEGEQFGHLTTNVFGANGLMACPDNQGNWQLYAALQNATVPNGNVSSCLGFDALTLDYSNPSSSNYSAWQYV